MTEKMTDNEELLEQIRLAAARLAADPEHREKARRAYAHAVQLLESDSRRRDRAREAFQRLCQALDGAAPDAAASRHKGARG